MRVVILGAGFGGLELAAALSDHVGNSADIVLVDQAEGFVFDESYTSVLKRAIRTLWTILDEMDLMWIPETKSWLLNERHYGALKGLNKTEMAAQYGEEQVQKWRRSFDIPPDPLAETDERWLGKDPALLHDRPG